MFFPGFLIVAEAVVVGVGLCRIGSDLVVLPRDGGQPAVLLDKFLFRSELADLLAVRDAVGVGFPNPPLSNSEIRTKKRNAKSISERANGTAVRG